VVGRQHLKIDNPIGKKSLAAKRVAAAHGFGRLTSLGTDSSQRKLLGGRQVRRDNSRDLHAFTKSKFAFASVSRRSTILEFAVLLIASPALAQSYDPEGSGIIISAVEWLQGTLMGTVATVVAVIAVAAVGFMMLTGRVNWRHGAVVILGCFILFGAASIVAGIRTAALG
jgi:type IV secretory pathway VirB2 component (pilin)